MKRSLTFHALAERQFLYRKKLKFILLLKSMRSVKFERKKYLKRNGETFVAMIKILNLIGKKQNENIWRSLMIVDTLFDREKHYNRSTKLNYLS